MSDLIDGDVLDIYEKVLDGKMDRFPCKFWKGDIGRMRARRVSRYLLEEKLNVFLTDLTRDDFYYNGLGYMLAHVYSDDVYRAIRDIYNE